MFDRDHQMINHAPVIEVSDTDTAVAAIIALANQNQDRAVGQADVPRKRSFRERIFGTSDSGISPDAAVIQSLGDTAAEQLIAAQFIPMQPHEEK